MFWGIKTNRAAPLYVFYRLAISLKLVIYLLIWEKGCSKSRNQKGPPSPFKCSLNGKKLFLYQVFPHPTCRNLTLDGNSTEEENWYELITEESL